jgi:hypothetical protein
MCPRRRNAFKAVTIENILETDAVGETMVTLNHHAGAPHS